MRTTALFLVLLAVGCTASKASIQIVSADDSLRRAREYDADELAEYEYTMAIRYLEKAKEKAGHSEFRIADALARQSAEWSDRAIIFVEKRGRSDLQLDDFTEAPARTPEPETTVPPEFLEPTPAPLPAPQPWPTEPAAPQPWPTEPAAPQPWPTEPQPWPTEPPPAPPSDPLDDILGTPAPGEPVTPGLGGGTP